MQGSMESVAGNWVVDFAVVVSLMGAPVLSEVMRISKRENEIQAHTAKKTPKPNSWPTGCDDLHLTSVRK